MSEAASPLCPITLYTPQGTDPHGPHPMVQLPADQSQPFTLKIDPDEHRYQMSFRNDLTAADNPHGWGVRIFFRAFHESTPSTSVWIHTIALPASGSQSLEILPLAGENAATDVWVGAWWDDGTYAATADGVLAYFVAHPEGGMHHTVPIRIG